VYRVAGQIAHGGNLLMCGAYRVGNVSLGEVAYRVARQIEHGGNLAVLGV
jgi:hypothetical protein